MEILLTLARLLLLAVSLWFWAVAIVRASQGSSVSAFNFYFPSITTASFVALMGWI